MSYFYVFNGNGYPNECLLRPSKTLITIISFCTTQSFYDLLRKSANKNFSLPTLRPIEYPKNLSHKKIMLNIIVAKVITKNFVFMFFFCYLLETLRKMSFYEGSQKITDFASLPCSPRLTLLCLVIFKNIIFYQME